jgi:hypothetical protein
MSETSQKQIEANRENGKLGGVKTEEGKAVSKYNALKHGILKEVVSDYEQSFYDDIQQRLNDHFSPVGVLEKVLVDRIGIYYLRLFRTAKAENEYMQSKLNRRRVTVRDRLGLDFDTTETIVENEGYLPRITHDEVEVLSNTYLRYEIAIENRLYKALHELQRLQSARNGELVPPPLALDVDISGEKENGFVS